MKKLLLAFTLLGLTIAHAKTYRLVLFEKSMLGSTELKPGEYSLEVKDQQAIFKNGQTKAEAPVKVQSESAKYGTTSVRYSNGDGRYRIQEIHIGGTNVRLVFND
jgi:hypothetical protein